MTNIDTSLPLRLTVRVVIKREGEICLCHKVRDGKIVDYNVPGGGVEDGDTMEQTAIKEALEEVGIRIHNVKAMGLRLPKHHVMGMAERNKIWSGTDTHYFEADFLSFDRTLHGSAGDALPFEWCTPEEAILKIKSGPQSEFNIMKVQAIESVMPKKAGAKPAFLSW
jgi:8-oxo-dGTP pyrophosphatase MutT (NUDIX family)